MTDKHQITLNKRIALSEQYGEIDGSIPATTKGSGYVEYIKRDDTITLDGNYTLDELRYFANVIEVYGGKNA